MQRDDSDAGRAVWAAERWRQVWLTQAEPPALAPFLAGFSHLPPRLLLDVLLVDQQLRWRTDRPLTTVDYLGLCPQLANHDDLILDLLYGEYRVRAQQGPSPDVEVLTEAFPQLRERLRRQAEIASWFDDRGSLLPVPIEEDTVAEAQPAGTQFGDYELCSEIARGGMGVVYRARHLKLQRAVALKMIRPERLACDADVRRFHNETVTIARLDHPNIIPILEVGQVDGVHYFTMRLVQGRDLNACSGRYRNDVRAAARLVQAVADAVHHAHQHGILHRDLKPSNVLVDESGVPFVVDFGLARQLAGGADLTLPDQFIGTPAFLAPEQLVATGQPLTVAADVYGLGTILYVALTGQPPFTGRTLLETLDKIGGTEPPRPRTLNPRVSADLERVCLKALEKKPADRYPSALALAEDLGRYLAGTPVQVRPVGWWERRWRWIRRHPTMAVGTATVLLAALVLLSLLSVQTYRLMRMQAAWNTVLETTQASRREAETHRRQTEAAQAAAEQMEYQAALAKAAAIQDRRQAQAARYVADLRLADVALRSGDASRARQLLDRQRPAAGAEDPRGFEWFLLDREASAAARFRRLGGSDATPPGPAPAADAEVKARRPAARLAFTPDSRRLAVAGPAGVRLWDVGSGEQSGTFSGGDQPYDQVAISADGRWLAAGSHPGAVVELWRLDAPGEKPVWQVRDLPSRGLVFAPDSQVLAAVIPDRNEVALVAVATGQRSTPIPAKACRTAEFSPDGRWLVIAAETGLLLWDWPARRQTRVLGAGREGATAVALGPDSRNLAAVRHDGNIGLWDRETGSPLRSLGSEGRLTQLRFVGPDRLLAISHPAGLGVWHAALGELLCAQPFASAAHVVAVAVSSDLRCLACLLDTGELELVDISRS